MRTLPLMLLCAACSRPPPAPEGLDASARYLLREIHADDRTLGAGLTGLLDWFDAEGYALVDLAADQSNVDGFVLADLTDEDVAHLEVADDGRALANANGVIGIAEIACSPAEAEPLLVRPDQDVVFDGDFDAYERVYVTDRDAFEAVTGAGWPAVDERIEEPSAHEASLLLTENEPTVSALGATVTYGFVRHFRHGTFEVQGEPTDVLLALGWVPEAASDGNTELRQNYGVELVIARPDAPSLRLFAVWTELVSPMITSDSPLVATSQVNTMRASAERLDALCTGEAELPAE